MPNQPLQATAKSGPRLSGTTFVRDMVLKVAALFLSVVTAANVASAADVCEKRVPESLRKEIANSFPTYRIAISTDQRSTDEEWNRINYREGTCPTVAGGDFDGDKRSDFALYLVEKEAATPKLVAALSRGHGWSISELPQWNEHIIGSYVERAKPGLYRHTESFDFKPTDAYEREQLVLKNGGIAAGRVEATRVIYAYEGGHWLYVWVSD
jgi:hypothetical protein